MSYDSANEKIPMAPLQTARPATVQDFKQNSDIRRKRLIVLILLGIQIVFTLFYLIERIISLVKYENLPNNQRNSKMAGSYIFGVVFGSLSVLYFIIYAVVTFKYVRIGILIFAWLGAVQLIGAGILVILVIIAAVALAALVGSFAVGVVLTVLVVAVAGVIFILTILTVIFSFQLAKLIKMQQAYQFV